MLLREMEGKQGSLKAIIQLVNELLWEVALSTVERVLALGWRLHSSTVANFCKDVVGRINEEPSYEGKDCGYLHVLGTSHIVLLLQVVEYVSVISHFNHNLYLIFVITGTLPVLSIQ